jgi:hypothetical protein
MEKSMNDNIIDDISHEKYHEISDKSDITHEQFIKQKYKNFFLWFNMELQYVINLYPKLNLYKTRLESDMYVFINMLYSVKDISDVDNVFALLCNKLEINQDAIKPDHIIKFKQYLDMFLELIS